MGAIGVQCFVTFILSALVFQAAFTIVWPSYALRMLGSTESPLGYIITKDDSNLIGSVLMLGSLAAVMIAGYISEKIGRRRSAILCALFFVLGWAITTTAKTVTQIVIGRFIVGFGGGMQAIVSLVFVGEISQICLRGTLLAALSFAFNIGTVASYIEGWFCTYQVINYINLTMSVGLVIALCFLKETPVYLMGEGYDKEALNSLMFYRGAKIITQTLSEEYDYIRSQQQGCSTKYKEADSGAALDEENMKLNKNDVIEQVEQSNLNQTSFRILLTSKSSQRAIIILSTQSVIVVYMGMIGIQTYAGQLFRRVAPDMSPDLCSVALALVISLAAAVAIFVTDLIPRRTLMISTSIMSALCMTLLSSILQWSWAPDWTIPLLIITFCVSMQLGPANVTFIQIGECITPKLISLGSTIVICNVLISNFILLYFFEPAIGVLGLQGVFGIFSAVCTLAILITYLFMRETKKQPSEIIQTMFECGYKYRKPAL